MHRPNPLSFAVCLLVASAALAQDWRSEKVHDCGIEFDAPGRLERLPMQLGEDSVHHRARLRPKDNQDFVRAQYYWYCDVYAFAKNPGKDGLPPLPEGLPPEMKEQLRKLMESSGWKQLKSFKEWLDEKDQKTVVVVAPGKAMKGKGGKLDYTHWVWTEKTGFGPVGIVYCEAAVYSFADQEVALVVEMPLETEKPKVPKSKWKTLIDRMMASGKALDPADSAEESDKKRDQYANTPEKQQALADAKKNIQGLQGWDYFTSPNYIVLYSWDFEKPDERSKAKKDSEFYSSRLEKMRELYLTNYPLDATGTKAIMPDPKSIPSLTGPITGVPTKPADKPGDKPDEPGDEPEDVPDEGPKLGIKPYSVFRLCATYDQFQKYGQSPPGVVGWYSPASKELVVFLGGDKMMGSGATETVTYHEGWHQYADFYFHHPETKKHGTLHRWFDEGHGDYFGSFRWGQNGWKYVGSKMRYDDCKNMVRQGDYVPFKEIVHWSRQRFYAQRAPYYYAQAYSMVDFFRRGQKERGFQARWGEALDMYRKVMLVHGDSKLASDTAFREMKDADWKAMEEAWKAWVGGNNFMNGK